MATHDRNTNAVKLPLKGAAPMTQDDLHKQEWANPANWRGPRWLNAYYSPRDTRFWVPKQFPKYSGWTINLGHPRAMRWLGLAGIVLCLAPALVVIPLRWISLLSSPGAWCWLAMSIALALVAASASGLVWKRLSWIPVCLFFGVMAALAGFGLQSMFNAPVVALLGGVANLTWRAHLYLALTAALAQTFGKAAFLVLAWFTLRAESTSDKMRSGLLVGLGFALFEIMLIWAQAVWSGETITGWWLGGAERGISSFFHVYATGLLAIALSRRQVRYPLFTLVIFLHYFTDWVAGANASLLHLSDLQIEALFAGLVAILYAVFLVFVRKVRGDSLST